MVYPLPEPQAREARPGWDTVPATIIRQLEQLLHDKIVAAETGWGGFSPAAVFVATLGSGKKVFIKGAHPGDDAHGTQMLRQEIEAHKTLEAVREMSPRLIGDVGDRGEDGWHLAVFEYIDTQETTGAEEKIRGILALLERAHTCRNVPAHIPRAAQKNYVEKFFKPEGGWLKIKQDKDIQRKVAGLFADVGAGEAWLKKNLPALCVLQEKSAEIGGPEGLLHQDLRMDNFLFARRGRTYLVDWPNYCAGPVALDVAAFLPMLGMACDIPAPRLLARYEEATGVTPGVKNLALALAALSGQMMDNAYRAVPARLPRLRWLQKVTCLGMLEWGVSLMGIEPTPVFKS